MFPVLSSRAILGWAVSSRSREGVVALGSMLSVAGLLTSVVLAACAPEPPVDELAEPGRGGSHPGPTPSEDGRSEGEQPRDAHPDGSLMSSAREGCDERITGVLLVGNAVFSAPCRISVDGDQIVVDGEPASTFLEEAAAAQTVQLQQIYDTSSTERLLRGCHFDLMRRANRLHGSDDDVREVVEVIKRTCDAVVRVTWDENPPPGDAVAGSLVHITMDGSNLDDCEPLCGSGRHNAVLVHVTGGAAPLV